MDVFGSRLQFAALLLFCCAWSSAMAQISASGDVRPPAMSPEQRALALGIPSPWTCLDAGPVAPPAAGASAGAWRDPQRHGTGWDFVPEANGQALRAVWYTFDRQRRPVWYRSSVSQVDSLRLSWRALLYREGSDPASERRNDALPVGAVSVRMLQGDLGRMVVRATLFDEGENARIESCLMHRSELTLSAPVHWLQAQMGSPFEWVTTPSSGTATLLTFDRGGHPTWLAMGPVLAGERALLHVYSNYPGSRFEAECAHSGCASSPRQLGRWREQPGPVEGVAASVRAEVSGHVAEVGQRLQWQYPATGDDFGEVRGTGLATITVTPTACTIPAGSTTCTVSLTWTSIPIFVPTARPYLRDMQTLEVTGPIADTGNGSNVQYPLTAGSWRFEMQTSSGTLLATSAQVEVGISSPPTGNPIGWRPAAECPVSAEPISPGDETPAIPGRYRNPEREGTWWSLTFTQDNQALVAWFSYDVHGEPEWYLSVPSEIGEGPDNGVTVQRFWAPLVRYRWNWKTNTRDDGTPVGNVAITFLPGDATRSTLRWKLDQPNTAIQNECIEAHGRGPWRLPESNLALHGFWYEPGLGGWGFFPHLGTFNGGTAIVENTLLAVYDLHGEPRWLLSDGEVSGPEWKTFPVGYQRSRFFGGLPLEPPTDRPVVNDAGIYGRSFDGNGATGQVHVELAQERGEIAWSRGKMEWPEPSAKLLRTDEITLSQHHCAVPIAANASCSVVVGWTSANAAARAWRLHIDSGNFEQLTPEQAMAQTTQTFTAPGRYRYFLRDTSSPTAADLAISAELVVTGSTAMLAPQASATGGLGVRVAWQAVTAATVDLGYSISATTPPTTPAASLLVGTQWDGDVPAAGTWYFFVRRCPEPAGTPCSPWSAPSNALTLTDQQPAIEIPDDPRGHYDPAAHDYQSPQAHSAVLAGATAGEAGVRGGAASYAIPISVPPGRQGMQPTLALEYSSRAGSGIAGMGFSLSSGSAISRCPWTIASDALNRAVAFDQWDRLCLDGQRLIAVAGAYGAADTVYRTEIDSYAEIIQLGGTLDADSGTYFELRSKDGERQFFGADQPGSVARGARVKPIGAPSGRTLSWLLDTRLSRSNNYVQYTYQTYGSGETLLREIRYTGFAGDPGDRGVVFTYQTRADRSSSYMAGALIEHTRVLSSIETWVTHSDNRVRRYELQHSPSAYSGKLLLRGVRECGFAAGAPKCLEPTTFEWQETAQEFRFSRWEIPSLPRPASAPDQAPLRAALTGLLLEAGAQIAPQASVGLLLAQLKQRLGLDGVAGARMPAELDGLLNPLTGTPSFAHIRPWADFDGDGTRDALYSVITESGQYRNYLMALDADRTLRGVIEIGPLGNGGEWITGIGGDATDVDSDGRADLLFLNTPGSQCPLKIGSWRGDWSAPFSAAQIAYTPLCGFSGLTNNELKTARLIDLNGDGHNDLVFRKYNSTAGQEQLWVAYALGRAIPNAPNLAFSSLHHVGGGLPAFGASFEDFNGDGVPDLVYQEYFNTLNGTWAPWTVRFASVVTVNGALIWQPATIATTCRQLLGNATGSTVDRLCESQSDRIAITRLDVNGDGLQDIAYQGSPQWHIRLNQGGTLGPEHVVIAPTGVASATGAAKSAIKGIGHNTERPPLPMLTVDLNADGRQELITPHRMALIRCDWSRFDDTPEGTSPPLPIVHAYGCPEPLPGETWVTPTSFDLSGDPNNPNPREVRLFQEDSQGDLQQRYLANSSLYQWKVMRFVQDAAGNWRLHEETEHSHLLAPLDVRRAGYTPDDLFGDGLADWSYYNVCPVVSTNEPGCIIAQGPDGFGNSYGPVTLPNYPGQVNTADLAMTGALYLSRNMGAGEGESGLGEVPAMPDSLLWVADGMGNRARWRYAPLSSTGGRVTGLMPLYRVPARASGEGYVDANHIYFSSSMYVVESFFETNGIGGENATRYGYEEAMFNLKGRGFVGFRKILSEDVANGLRHATVFEQKFPLVSRPVCEVSQELTDSLSDLHCQSSKVLTLSTFSDYRCNDGACNQLSPAPGTAWRVQSRRAESRSRDLLNRNLILSDSLTEILNSDIYGNILHERSTVTDYDAGAVLRTQVSEQYSEYSHDPGQWWVNRLVRSRGVHSHSYGSAHAGGPTAIPDRSTVNLYGYHPSSRQRNCEELQPGDYVGSVCGVAPTYETRVSRSFDTWGNLASETTLARDVAQDRSVSISHVDSGGYFPNQVIDIHNRVQYTGFDPGSGVPVLRVDANGLSTSTTLDALGRVLRVQAPERDGLRVAMPATTSYEICGQMSVQCPQWAAMRVVQSQYGSPQSITYLDARGRTVRTSTKLMDAPYVVNGSQLDDTNASVADTQYNARGLLQRQYEPARGDHNDQAYTDHEYDVLGRVTVKRQRFNRVDQAQLGGGLNFRRSEYTHSGLDTTIRVCQTHDETTACAGTGVNADGSPQLTLSRRHDSAGRLVRTQDALGQATRYWVDATDNPLRVTDVMGYSIVAVYNDFGQRLSLTDPSSGHWTFTSNGYGELTSRTDARGLETSYVYDRLGRQIERTWSEPGRYGSGTVHHREEFVYDNSSNTAYGTLQRVERVSGTPGTAEYARYQASSEYDTLARPTTSTTEVQVGTGAMRQFVRSTRYDSRFGRIKQLVLPNSAIDGHPVSLYQAYNNVGAPVREGFAADYLSATPELSDAVHTLNGVDGRGLPISESFGVRGAQADWRSTHVYDSSGWLLAQCVNASGACSEDQPTTTSNQPLDQRYRYDVYGNLVRQWHNGLWMQQGAPLANSMIGEMSYRYDRLHRLEHSSRRDAQGQVREVNYQFNAIGGLLSKSDYSSSAANAYQYAQGSHRLTGVSLQSGQSASYVHDANGNVTSRTEAGVQTQLVYDIDNRPRAISRNGQQSQFYEGGGSRYLQRLHAVSGTRDTWMLGQGYEREEWNGQVQVERYYLGGGALLTVRPGMGRKLSYLHKDRLGSPVSITEKTLPTNGTLGNAAPQLVEHRGFEAYGAALDGLWGESNQGWLNPPGGLFHLGQRNQRGYTGHEHLDEFALIHMNGRLYDQRLGRFLGVDPIVQFPANSQSLNPYSYIMNNPLAGTDPTGYAAECGGPNQDGCDDDQRQYRPGERPTGSNIPCRVKSDGCDGGGSRRVGGSGGGKSSESTSNTSSAPGYNGPAENGAGGGSKAGATHGAAEDASAIGSYKPGGAIRTHTVCNVGCHGNDYSKHRYATEEEQQLLDYLAMGVDLAMPIPPLYTTAKIGQKAGAEAPQAWRMVDAAADSAKGLGGFKFGISADEISALNRAFGNGVAYRQVDTVMANASRYDGFYNKSASVIRDIAGGHLFENGNKRTAVAVVEMLISRNGVSGPPQAVIWNVVDRVATGELKDVRAISKALQGF